MMRSLFPQAAPVQTIELQAASHADVFTGVRPVRGLWHLRACSSFNRMSATLCAEEQ